MRRLTTLAMVLALLGGIGGCGSSGSSGEHTTATATTAEETEQQREEKEHPELVAGSKYWQEKEGLEHSRVAEGRPANAKDAEAEAKKVEAEDKKDESTEHRVGEDEPAHNSAWYEDQASRDSKEVGALSLAAHCREVHGPEALLTSHSGDEELEGQIPTEGTCKTPSGEEWVVHQPGWTSPE